MRCPRCRQDTRPGATLCPKCGASLRRSARRSGPASMDPNLNAIAKTAARLCDAHDAQIFLADGATLRLVAQHMVKATDVLNTSSPEAIAGLVYEPFLSGFPKASMQPVARPLGESRSDLSILQALAERLGFGPSMTGSASEWIDAASQPLRAAGIGYGALKAAGGRLWPEGQARVPWADGRFATPSGLLVFPDRFDDEPVLPTVDFPLHLIAQATADAMNSQILEADQDDLVGAEVSPDVAVQAGVADGDVAALVSPRGRFEVRVRID